MAYLLGLEGAALMHAFNGDYGRDFTEARLAEVRALLDSADRFGDAEETRPITIAEGYAAWVGRYDQPGNGLIDLNSPSFGRSWTGCRRAPRLMPPAAPVATPSTSLARPYSDRR
jgi:hypothetical protein